MPNNPESRATAVKPRAVTPFYGIPLRISLAILATAILVGFLLSIGSHTISSLVLIVYILAALSVTVLSQPRNLFIVVSCVPIGLSATLILAGWMTTGAGSGITEIVTAIYPFTQHFPVMILLTIGCVAIAFVRLYLLRRRDQITSQSRSNQRTAEKIQAQRNVAATTKSRRQATNAANQVTVQDLLARRNNRQRQQSRSSRPDGGARTYAPRRSEETNDASRNTRSTERTRDTTTSRPQDSRRSMPTRDSASPRERTFTRPPETSPYKGTKQDQRHSGSTRVPYPATERNPQRTAATNTRNQSARPQQAKQQDRVRRTSSYDREHPTHEQVPRRRLQ
ncbi:MAG: hypothetical protein Q3976_00750 [Corynebacterium sp.]|nr:hypothetical protein [Corynebacterium sp.]